MEKKTLETVVPGWTDKLFKIRKDIARYEDAKAEAALCMKELKIAETRLLRMVESIQSALDADDASLLSYELEQYNQNG